MIPLKKAIVMIAMLPIYALAACNGAINATTPSSDFIVHNNGTVTHLKTGLMWKVCSEGQQAWHNKYYSDCAGNAGSYTWPQALQIPRTLNSSGGYAGYTDWRLPNIKELESIVELQCTQPTINSVIFPRTANDFYWSSTFYGYRHYGAAWGVHFATALVNFGHFNFDDSPVRLVRGGQ